MFSFDTAFDFTRIRNYHPEIGFIAASIERRNQPVYSINQTAYIDVKSEAEYRSFLIDYDHLIESYNLKEENVLDLIFLTQKTYSDIELANENSSEQLEADSNLSFLIEVVKMQEKDKAKKEAKAIKTGTSRSSTFPNLSIMIQNQDGEGSATLKNPIITNYVISQILKAFKDKSYNSVLAATLIKIDKNWHEQDIELSSANLIHIQNQLNYRSRDVKRYCTTQTATRIHHYLNEQTSFSSPTNGLLNKQARFIFDLLQLFNLLKNIIDLKDIPRDKSKIDNYKTSVIKTLIKNNNLLQKEAK